MTDSAEEKSIDSSVSATGDEGADDGSGTEPAVDGRRLRRDRNREAVVASLVDLIEDGCPVPTAAQIAERSGVSLRSVFRYFEDRDELMAEARDVAYLRYSPLAAIPNYGNGHFEDRLQAIVDQRLRLLPAITPILRSARVRGATGETIYTDSLADHLRPIDEQVAVQFGAELEHLGEHAATIATSLTVLLSPETYELLTVTQSRGLDEVRAIYEVTIRSLVARPSE